MFTEPARCYRPPTKSSKLAQTPSGGNLARVPFTNAGHFSFPTKSAQQFKADFTNPNEAGLSSLPARKGAGAALHRLPSQSTEPRPHPLTFQTFVKVDHVSHHRLLSDREAIRTSFRDGGIFIREDR